MNIFFWKYKKCFICGKRSRKSQLIESSKRYSFLDDCFIERTYFHQFCFDSVIGSPELFNTEVISMANKIMTEKVSHEKNRAYQRSRMIEVMNETSNKAGDV